MRQEDFFVVGRIVAVVDAQGALEARLEVDGDWDRLTSIYLETDEGGLMPYFLEAVTGEGLTRVLRLTGVETAGAAHWFVERQIYLSNGLRERFR